MAQSLRFLRNLMSSPASAISLSIVVAAVGLALVTPFLGLPDPNAMGGKPYLPPSAEHWFGTDNYGRDLFSRVIWGTRVALVVAIGSAALSVLLGIIVGSLAGYYGGWVDALLSRVFDVFLLIPTFFLILLIVALFGSNLVLTMVAIALTTWPRSARIIRSQVLSIKSRVYVQAALAAGASNMQVLFRHVIPNGLAPLVTDATLLMGLAILTEAGLSFLGLGDQNTVSWGRMIFEGQRQLRLAPWMSIAPGAAMLILVASLNLLGDGLNYAMNPQLRSRGGAPAKRRLAAPPADDEAPGGPVILTVRDLRMAYHANGGQTVAVDGVSFDLPRGGSLGIVGESGCGKSSLGSALLQTLPNNAQIIDGTVRFDGRAILAQGHPVGERGRARIQALRWVRLATIFQSAMNALNPVTTVRKQMRDAFLLHRPGATRADADRRIAEVFDLIGIPRKRMDAYPHELSGGMRQRAMIALSLIHEPDLVIADEPTTALDMIIQDQILAEIDRLRRRMNLSLILVSHDMGAVAETCDTVAVMYAGRIVELAPTEVIFQNPAHPYTRALIESLPSLAGPKRPLTSLPGDGSQRPANGKGCRFAPRCIHAGEICRTEMPPDIRLDAKHRAECHYAGQFAHEPRRESVR
ncbi:MULTISPECIES: dipeptide/oligopeptide/nickel ABC transporter permease/ATP-binding protein [unclassified Chelatococcus]|uniref:dipeptide/oligopeptide/nickel ABC transporter permease/ATP-binding protein n=1 Tax=unclassified Chelatococcus TaxID=2638111 RepID=UPI001BCDC8BC|nr:MULTISPECIES: dipeptide/oligopeptide/nickel ABC transporter permease/ATP-binding protein [unclassified Chelatococcus]CAH1656703.1 Peptide/opine/nickel uptake family ABC transporter, permease/ATP-binding protein [Hyphomicrobiales bacterium]MBS7742414.1 dipeptide/oligopeptide/nickel ABC transporter permease/ATP-binding protein [Chelatococcus sp. HY11]MBX3542468.1 dipeptide/oligopeptide/nickel ABC transporter permease/ATP-binding protein [Chelatococcus sp.]MCO5075315.1 dipeptide/oligopeptide/ni